MGGAGLSGSSRVIVVSCIISFPAFFHVTVWRSSKKHEMLPVKLLFPITPSVSADFRRQAVNKKRYVANTAIVTRILPYMPPYFN